MGRISSSIKDPHRAFLKFIARFHFALWLISKHHASNHLPPYGYFSVSNNSNPYWTQKEVNSTAIFQELFRGQGNIVRDSQLGIIGSIFLTFQWEQSFFWNRRVQMQCINHDTKYSGHFLCMEICQTFGMVHRWFEVCYKSFLITPNIISPGVPCDSQVSPQKQFLYEKAQYDICC